MPENGLVETQVGVAWSGIWRKYLGAMWCFPLLVGPKKARKSNSKFWSPRAELGILLILLGSSHSESVQFGASLRKGQQSTVSRSKY
jgi:hypothetical protein